MGLLGGGFLRLLQTAIYVLCFCCAGLALGIYSYFLAVLSKHHLEIANWKRAVEGIAGVGTLFSIFAILLTCFLGGKPFFAFLAIVLDLCLVGAFIANAVMTRQGANSCSGNVDTPLGTGPDNGNVFGNKLGLACKLNTTVFAVSIIGALLFLIAALVQIFLVRHHKKDQRFGPSPQNNYTSGPPKRQFWQRKTAAPNTATDTYGGGDAELGTVGAGGLAALHRNDVRPSHETGYTGSTVAAPSGAHAVFGKEVDPTTGLHDGHAPHVGSTPHASHGGYYTAPQGTAANPYGYDNSRTANVGSNF